MYPRRCLFITTMLLLACPSSALPQSDISAANFTLQVASFPDTELANKFVIGLVKAGEHPACATLELQGRGYWTRVYLGLFSSSDAARRYGDNLKARAIIAEYLVRKADLSQAVTRPRRVSTNPTTESANRPADSSQSLSSSFSSPKSSLPVGDAASRLPHTGKNGDPSRRSQANQAAVTTLPVIRVTPTSLAPIIHTASIPRPDPAALAFRLIVGDWSSGPDKSRSRGGLWLSGDTAEGLSRLRWIAGEENASAIKISEGGRVELDERLLARAAGIGPAKADDPLEIASYISSNEGLLLLVQMAEGEYRYLLHIGNQSPTRGRPVAVSGSINLDNNYDSRINPYRKNGRKLNEERPPEGFAAMVGLNPVAQWFNLSTHSWVPVGEITLHELAEAYAKVALGLDYLEQGSDPGAHALALERERRLKAQRPGAEIVLTAGSNRMLKSQAEIRLFYAESAGELGKQ